MMVRRYRSWLLPLALTALVQACALDHKRQTWERDFYYSERLYIDDQHDLAAQRFAVLRKQAVDDRDADEAALMQCEVQSRDHKYREAAGCYDELAATAARRPMRARAVLHGGELRYYQLNRQQDALTMWARLVERAPDEPAALRALDYLYLYGDQDAEKRTAMVQRLLELERAAPDNEIADNLLLRAAMLLERDGRPEALKRAVELLERQERDHREDSTLVDCLMTRARVYQKLGDLKKEARDLERMINTYETSYVFASYGYDDHKPASLRLIELYRGPLSDPERAEFHARNLPDMLRRPLHQARYLVTQAETQEQQGRKIEALHSYREVLAFVWRRNQDFRKNDQRICSEMDVQAERQKCEAEIGQLTDVEPKECAIARERILKLEAELHVTHQPEPGQAVAGKPTTGAP